MRGGNGGYGRRFERENKNIWRRDLDKDKIHANHEDRNPE